MPENEELSVFAWLQMYRSSPYPKTGPKFELLFIAYYFFLLLSDILWLFVTENKNEDNN